MAIAYCCLHLEVPGCLEQPPVVGWLLGAGRAQYVVHNGPGGLLDDPSSPYLHMVLSSLCCLNEIANVHRVMVLLRLLSKV